MPNIGPLEIGVVLIIALMVFGPKRLPELGRSLGKGMRDFKGSLSGDDDGDRVEGAEAERHEPPQLPSAPVARAQRSEEQSGVGSTS